jgi:hypothetical protein
VYARLLWDYKIDMLLFIFLAALLIYFALLGAGVSSLYAELVVTILIFIILAYSLEGGPEGDDDKARLLRNRLRRWGLRAVIGCVVGMLFLFAGPKVDLSWWIINFTFNPALLGYGFSGVSFIGFVFYWLRIVRETEPSSSSAPSVTNV